MHAHTPGPVTANGCHVLGTEGNIVAITGSEADSQRIAKAWNCHDDMLAALKALLNIDNPEPGCSGHIDMPVALDMCRAAVAKAQEKE